MLLHLVYTKLCESRNLRVQRFVHTPPAVRQKTEKSTSSMSCALSSPMLWCPLSIVVVVVVAVIVVAFYSAVFFYPKFCARSNLGSLLYIVSFAPVLHTCVSVYPRVIYTQAHFPVCFAGWAGLVSFPVLRWVFLIVLRCCFCETVMSDGHRKVQIMTREDYCYCCYCRGLSWMCVSQSADSRLSFSTFLVSFLCLYFGSPSLFRKIVSFISFWLS